MDRSSIIGVTVGIIRFCLNGILTWLFSDFPNSLGSLYEVVEPAVRSLTNDSRLLDTIHDFLTGVNKAKVSADNGTDWASLLDSLAPLMDAMTTLISNNTSLVDTLTSMFNLPLHDLYNVPALLMGNSSGMEHFDEQSVNRTLDSIQVMLDSLLGNETMGKLPLLGKHSLLMVTDIMKFYTDIDEALSYSIVYNSAVPDVARLFVRMGPGDTSQLLREMVRLKNMDSLITGELETETACRDTVAAVFPDMEPAERATILDTVCSDNITSMVSDMMDKQSFHELTSMFDSSMRTMNDIVNGKHKTSEDFGVQELYYFAVDKFGEMEEMMANRNHNMEIILYNISSSVTYDFYNEEWSKAWRTVAIQYTSTNLVIMFREVMQSVARSGPAIWDVLGLYVQTYDAIMASVVAPLRTLSGLDDETTVEGQLLLYAEYLPDIMAALMNESDSDEHLQTIEKLAAGDMATLDQLCDDHRLLKLSLPGEVPVADIERFVCTTDWSTWLQEMGDLYNIGSIAQQIEQHINETTMSGINWEDMGTNMAETFDILMEYETFAPQGMWDLMSGINVTSPWSTLQSMFGPMPNITADQLSGYSLLAAPVLDGLDAALQNVTIWRLLKHELLAWQASVSIINDYLVTSQSAEFNLTAYVVTDMSPTLAEYLTNSSLYIPDLMDAITDSLSNPLKLLERLFTMDWTGVCDGRSVSRLLGLPPSANVTKFEEGLCELNWTSIVDELRRNNPDMGTYLDKIELLSSDLASVPDVAVNWTGVVRTFEAYLAAVANYTWAPGDWGLDNDRLNMSWSQFANIFHITNGLDVLTFTGMADKLVSLLSDLGEDNSMMPSLVSEVKDALALQTYIQYQFLSFYTRQLEYINSTNPIDLQRYLNSTEANKLIELAGNSAEMSRVWLYNALQFTQHADRMETLLSANFSSVCSDVTAFGAVFEIPADATLTIGEMRDGVCDLDVNTTRLLQELSDSLPGFADLLDALALMENWDNFNASEHFVNYTEYAKLQEYYIELLEDVISSPPNVTVFWSDPSATWERLLQQLQDFSRDVDVFGEFSNNSHVEGAIAVDKLIPGSEVSRILATADLVMGFILEQLNNTKDNMTLESPMDSAELTSLLESLLNLADRSLADLNNTVDVEKLLAVVERPMVLRDHCANSSLAAWLTVAGQAPSPAPQDIATILCLRPDISLQALHNEAAYRDFQQQLMDIWNGTSNSTRDWLSVSRKAERLVSFMEDYLSSAWPMSNTDLSSWMDFNGTIKFISDVFTDPKIVAKMVRLLVPSLGEPVLEMSDNVVRRIFHFLSGINAANVTLDSLINEPDAMKMLLETMLSVDYQLAVYSGGRVQTVIEAAGNSALVRDFVCNVTAMEALASELYMKALASELYMKGSEFSQPMSIVKDAVCNQDASEWYSRLLDRDLTFDDMRILQDLFQWVGGELGRGMSWDDVIDMAQELVDMLRGSQWWNVDNRAFPNSTMDRFTSMADKLVSLLSDMGEDNSMMPSLVSEVTDALALQTYIQYQFLSFYTRQLEYINSTNPIDVQRYLNSTEANKFFELAGNSAEMSTVWLYNALQFTQHADRMETLLSANFSSVCSDVAAFGAVFEIPADATLTIGEMRDGVCDLDVNTTRLLQELSDSLPGFADLLDALALMENWDNFNASEHFVSYTEYAKLQEYYIELLEDVISSPPNVTVFWSDPSATWERLLQQLQDFSRDVDVFGVFSNNSHVEGAIAVDKLIPGSEVSRILATADLVMGFILEQLNNTKDNMTLESPMDSAELTSLLESLLNLADRSLADLNNTVDVEKLLAVVERPMVLRDHCANSSLAAWLTVAGQAPSTAPQDVATILCLHPDISLQALHNEAAYRDFQQQLMDIWNGTSNSTRDWLSVSRKAEKLVSFMEDYLSSAWPMSNTDLSSWMDFNGTIKFISDVFTDSKIVAKMMRLLVPSLGDPVLEMSDSVVRRLFHFFSGINAANVTLDSLINEPDAMKMLLETMLSVDYQLAVYSGGRVQTVIEAAGNSALVRDFVCNVTAMEALASELYMKGSVFSQPMSIVKDAVCNQDASEWYSRLLDRDLTFDDMRILQDLFQWVGGELGRGMSWDDVIDMAQELVDMLRGSQWWNVDNISWPADSVLSGSDRAFPNSTMDSIYELLGMLDDSLGKMKEWRDLVATVLTFQDYVDRQVQRLSASEWKIPLSTLLPDPNKVAEIFNSTMNAQSTALFMTALLRPDQFIELMISKNWTDIVCDYAAFTNIFSFPDGVDILALQADICDMHLGMEHGFEDLLSTFNVTDTFNEINAWLEKQTSQRPVWEQLSRQTQLFMDNVARLQNHSNTDVANWARLISEALTLYSAKPTNSWTAICTDTVQYISGTAFYKNTLKQTLDSISVSAEVAHMSMYLHLQLHSAVCDTPTDDLTGLVDELKARNIPDLIQWVAEKYSSDVDDILFNCDDTPKYVNGLMDVLTETIEMFANNSEATLECMKDAYMKSDKLIGDIETRYRHRATIPKTLAILCACYNSPMLQNAAAMLSFIGGIRPAIRRLFNAGGEILNVLEDAQFREVMTTLFGNADLLNMTASLLEAFLQQEKAASQLKDILLKNITNAEQLLQDAYDIAPDALKQFLGLTMDLDMTNITADALITAVCESDTTQLDVDLNITVCGADRELAENVADSIIRLAHMLDELQSLNSSDTSDWWEVLAGDLSELLSDIDGISELASVVADLGDIDITSIQDNGQLLYTIQRLLLDSGPDSLINSFNAVLDNFGAIDRTNRTAEIIDSIKFITRGLLSFKTLRQLFFANVRLSDIVTNAEELNDYMVDTLGISEDVAAAIIDGSLSFQVLLKASQVDVIDWVCNSSRLAELITMNHTSVNASVISKGFCALDQDTVTAILQGALARISIGELVTEFATNTVDNMLQDANITMVDIEDSISRLDDAQSDFNTIIQRLDDYPDDLATAFANVAEAQIGSAGLSSLSAILCGDKIPDVSDDFNIGDKAESTSQLSANQLLERAELPGEVCKDMYTDIMAELQGTIIWSFLKPLIRGRILFAPDTPATRQIIHEMNSTFRTIENVLSVAETWAMGSVGLENLVGDELVEIQELLASPLVGGILTHVSGISVSRFNDMLYTLNGTDGELVGGVARGARSLADYAACLQLDRFHGFSTEAQLEAEAFHLGRTNDLLAGIIFTNVNDTSIQKRSVTNGNGLPKHIKYKIRVDLDNIRHTNMLKRRFWRPIPDADFANDLRYFRGFVQLQDLLDMAIIRVQTGADLSNVSITTQQFPSVCHIDDLYLSAMTSYILPILITVAWVAGLAIAVNNLVYDRENGQEEILKAMGLIGWLNWWAWFLSTMFIMAFVAIIAILMLSYGGIFPTSNILILFLYLLDFCFSATLLCYFVSAFFTRTSLAILVSLIVYFISYLPFVVILTLEVDMQFWHKILTCLSCTTAFSFGAQYIARYEEQQLGMQWENVHDSPIHNDEMNLYWCFIMMLIDGAAYLVLGWYVRNVKAGKFGVSNPWYFPVSPSYWGLSQPSVNKRYRPGPDGEYIEASETRQPVVMSVRGLGKTFSNAHRAVDNLYLDIHGGQVTTLLGHNGAAKTTTMCMLSGIMEATTGEVRINNRPQRRMKESIGICPQHNALFEYMTVQEHMEFVQSIKSGLSGRSSKEDIDQLLKDVDLYHCRHSRVGELSGGMQRRLCVAMAFIGRSKVVILDEPTSGIDPSGRRTIWNLIIRRKCRTAIVLSSHHLDEADIISDRIAILHQGRILCLGSPMFLKQRLTSGHVLRILMDPTSPDAEPTQIVHAIQRWVPSARLQQAVTYELTFSLPAASHAHLYQLFQNLEANKGPLHITHIAVSDPTLEEAFMKVCKVADTGLELTPATVAASLDDDDTSKMDNGADLVKDMSVNIDHVSRQQRSSGLSWKLGQLGALLTKRFHHYRRNWRMIISVVVLPILLFLLANAVYSVKPNMSETPNLYLSPAMYGPDSYVFMKDDSTLPLSSKVIDTFESQPGIGTSCMDGMTGLPGKFQCVTAGAEFSVPGFEYNPNASCTCDDFKYTCSGGSAREPPAQLVTTTTDVLQDLQGRDIDSYLRETFFQFIEKRYGGWSMEDESTNTSSPPKLKSTVWYNNRGFHAIPAFYSAYTTGLLRASVNTTVHGPAGDYGISAYNHPLLISKVQLSRETLLQSAADCGIALVMLLAFTFIPVGIATYAVHEYISREKHVQFASGVGPALYWTASLVWDLVILAVCVGLSVAILAIFQNDSFWQHNNLSAVVVLILLYGWATITFGYCMVKLFKTVASSFFTLFCLHNFLGIATLSCVFSLEYYKSYKNIEHAYEVLRYAFLVFPPYAFSSGLVNLITNQIQADVFARFGVDVYTEPFTFDLIGWNCVALAAEGFVFIIVAMLLDMISPNLRSPLVLAAPLYEDDDVTAERQRVQHGASDDVLTVMDLSKVYRRAGKEFPAVDHISFGVSKGECFGLLGVNGAGKTTSFKILTGALSASGGRTYLHGQSVREGSSRLGWDVGYCPQEEALDLFLTVHEMLHFHAKLRGIQPTHRNDAVNSVIDQLNIETIRNKIVKTCSGGMRRKLSLAIALLGDPSIILLDEPTTGMDATAKRLAWHSLIAAREKGQAIILTSHSMEECDVLCNRLAIMVNGQFKCLGSPQHLKNKFGDGYTVTLYMCGLSANKSMLFELIQTHFPGSSIRDCHENVLQLDIPHGVAEVSTIFRVLDTEKDRYNILYYTISQTTLETIFLNFAREQTDDSPHDISDSSASSGAESNSNTVLRGEPLANAKYAYMNTAYDFQSDRSTINDNAAFRLPRPKVSATVPESFVTKL